MSEITTYLPGILLAYSVFFIGIASPGPNIVAVMGTSMEVGRREGVALALGVAFGSFTWAVLTAIGLSALLTQYAAALTIIKWAGGAYLLFLAFKAFKASASTQVLTARRLEGEVKSPLRYTVRGYLIQMTNPKAALVWIAIISLGLTPGAPLWVAAVIVAGTFILSIIMHVLYALAFSTPPMVRLYGRARRTIQFVLGGFFAFAGIRLFTSRV